MRTARSLCLVLAALATASSVAAAESTGGDEKAARAGQPAKRFTYANSDEDLLRGFITYSRKTHDGYVAYVLLRWGDLDRKIQGCSKEHYSNWDGHVKVSAGRARVARKIAFDDGARRTDADKGGGPGPGSGRDRIVPDGDPSKIVWQAGVVGATDGLLIRLDLPGPRAVCRVKAGNFSFNLAVRPRREPPVPDGDDADEQ